MTILEDYMQCVREIQRYKAYWESRQMPPPESVAVPAKWASAVQKTDGTDVVLGIRLRPVQERKRYSRKNMAKIA